MFTKPDWYFFPIVAVFDVFAIASSSVQYYLTVAYSVRCDAWLRHSAG